MRGFVRKKTLVIISILIIIIFSGGIFKYLEFNNKRLNLMSDRILWLAANTFNSVYDVTDNSSTEEYFNKESKELIYNLYALQNVLESAQILLVGEGSNGSSIYLHLNNIATGLKYNNVNEKSIQELNAIKSATNILIDKLRPYEGDGKNISKKELLSTIQLALNELRMIEFLSN